MPVLNDVQSPRPLPPSRTRSTSAEADCPADTQESMTLPLYDQDETGLPRVEALSTKPSVEDAGHMTGVENTPSPSMVDGEPKEKEPVDASAATALVSPTHLQNDGWVSGSAVPGILAPPKRPKFTSSFLRPGSRFAGKQQSDKQEYRVEVTFKSVDIRNSFLCGYLRIEGLTKDHPTLTTYFEGEIIGTKYTFQTKHEKWGATEKTDMQHWNRFLAWRPLATQAKRADFHYKNYMEKENVFMRWKEYFLVPDHQVREIQGASFEGFYYICFNQVKGTVSGIYFHAKSEKYQQLDLEHVDDLCGFAALQFR